MLCVSCTIQATQSKFRRKSRAALLRGCVRWGESQGGRGKLVWISGLVTCPCQRQPPLPFRASSPNPLHLRDPHRQHAASMPARGACAPALLCLQPAQLLPWALRSALQCCPPSNALPGHPCPDPSTTHAHASTLPCFVLFLAQSPRTALYIQLIWFYPPSSLLERMLHTGRGLSLQRCILSTVNSAPGTQHTQSRYLFMDERVLSLVPHLTDSPRTDFVSPSVCREPRQCARRHQTPFCSPAGHPASTLSPFIQDVQAIRSPDSALLQKLP